MQDRGVVAVLMRRWLLVALASAAVSAVAVAVGYLAPEKHQVTSTFHVREALVSSVGMLGVPQGPASSLQDWRVLPAPLKSRTLVEAALERSGLEVDDVAGFLEDDVDLNSADQTHVSTVKVTYEGTAEEAETLTTAMLEELDEYLVADYLQVLEYRIQAVESQLDAAWERVRKLPSEEGAAAIELPVDGGTAAYDSLSQQYSELQIARDATKSLVVVMDQPLAERVSPAPVRNAAVGLVCGLFAGFGVALILDASDRRRERSVRA